MHSFTKDKGFTLIELIIVIFIVSLFAVISLPSFKGYESDRIRAEAKRLASILRYLNDTALFRKEELYLIVNFRDNSVIYKTEEGEKREELEFLKGLFLETKGEVRNGEVKIIFTPLGAREFMSFNLSDQLRVELNPVSGRVRVRG